MYSKLVLISAMALTTLSVNGVVLADAGHDKPDSSNQMPMMGEKMGAMPQADHAGGGHAHTAWADVPAEYQKYRSDSWQDQAAADRGEKTFAQQCASCHGLDGTGNGPIATALAHPPADLTNHFHIMPGDGDAYLFWRVSEGGAAEPFKSAGSVMPAFKSSLSEQQRWDVLNYVHTQYHKGFKTAAGNDAMEVTHNGMPKKI